MHYYISIKKSFIVLFVIGIIVSGISFSWSQMGPPYGEGFILTFKSFNINSLAELNNRKICGSSRSFIAFVSHTGLNNAIHINVPFSEGYTAMNVGMCDAVVAYSTDIGMIRHLSEMWRNKNSMKVLNFP